MAKKKMSKPNLAKLIVAQRLEDLQQIIPSLEEMYELKTQNGDRPGAVKVALKLHRYKTEYREMTGQDFASKVYIPVPPVNLKEVERQRWVS